MIGMTNVVRRQQPVVSFDGLTFDGSDGYLILEYTETGYSSGEEPIIYYSGDAENWTRLYSGDIIDQFSIVYLKGNNPNGIGYGENGTSESNTVAPSKYINFCCKGAGCKVYGNLYSLLDNGDGSTVTTIPNDFCFANIFKDSYGLVDASDLELSAMNLTSNCYRGMFSGCDALESAPSLPATTVPHWAYAVMFNGCSSLQTAPSLPATTLYPRCYANMFSNSGLTTAPTLSATTLANFCYSFMFNNCTSLTTPPTLSATTLANYCYFHMFDGCSALTFPSGYTLPATTMYQYCYSHMFYNCSFSTAPSGLLPATTLATYCYQYMFSGNNNLSQVNFTLPATTTANYCYQYMFENCSSLVNAPDIYFSGTTGRASRCAYMFRSCSSLRYIKLVNYTGTITSSNGFSNWVQNVGGGGTIYYKGSTATQGASAIPSGWTKVTSW